MITKLRFLTILLCIFTIAVYFTACKDDDPDVIITTKGDLEDIPYQTTAYNLVVPEGFPEMIIPADNKLTEQGVELGRHLFFDPILSLDSTISCSSCHLPVGNFTDNKAISPGVNGALGKISSMALLNVGYFENGLFWDGRSETLEEQAELPVEDPVEMHEEWPNVIEKLKRHSRYPRMFREAFGIKDRSEISKELAAKALAQFERTLVSSGDSKYDRWQRGEVFLTEDEFLGYDMFFDLSPDLPDAECGHCHNAPIFSTNDYFNNGITEAATLYDFPDLGRGEVTGRPIDNGRFRAPSLRNITLSAPYMHNGSFQTLEEVLEHYNSGGKPSPNRDPLLRPLGLTDEQKEQVLTFIHTLTDTTFVNNPAYQSPFK
jgi:cytochrome c peroxidase